MDLLESKEVDFSKDGLVHKLAKVIPDFLRVPGNMTPNLVKKYNELKEKLIGYIDKCIEEESKKQTITLYFYMDRNNQRKFITRLIFPEIDKEVEKQITTVRRESRSGDLSDIELLKEFRPFLINFALLRDACVKKMDKQLVAVMVELHEILSELLEMVDIDIPSNILMREHKKLTDILCIKNPDGKESAPSTFSAHVLWCHLNCIIDTFDSKK